MPDVTAYVDDRQSSEFYPTPEKLVQRMLGKIKWDPVEAILEPSAGKGDILRGLATAPIRKTQLNRLSIDCIEIDPNLRGGLTMQENRCIACGRIIPEGRHICLACGDYDDMQTFSQPARKPSKRKIYFRIVDECGWTQYISTDREDACAANIVLLTPHVRSAVEISREEFEEAQR